MDGLLIDYGGVLTTSVLASFDAFGPGVRDAFRDGGARQPLIDLENGDISLAVFEARVASVLGTDAHNLANRLMAHAEPDHAMRDAVRRFHDAGVKTALVSNSWRHADYDGLDDAFDVMVLSQRLGIRKPDPRIYEEALKGLELPATQCVFVDDLGGNLKPAKRLGMTTIRHERAESTIAELDRLLLPRRS
jgi:epoxide hydrolase-like predicted phosphatase